MFHTKELMSHAKVVRYNPLSPSLLLTPVCFIQTKTILDRKQQFQLFVQQKMNDEFESAKMCAIFTILALPINELCTVTVMDVVKAITIR